MAATDARPIPQKNVAYRATFPILDADGDTVTAATALDSEVSLDGGTFADCTNEATEIATSSGVYFLDLTAAEMNADTVAVIVKTTTTGAKTTVLVLHPEEAGDIRVNLTQWSGTAPNALVTGRVDASTGAMAANVLTAAAINADAITAAKVAADVSTEIAAAVWNEDATGHQTQGSFGQVLGDSGADTDSVWSLANTNLDTTVSSRASAAALTTAQADLDDIQTRLPTALVAGRMDASVGAMAAGVVTAAAVATGAIDADALAADAVTEIRSLVSGTAGSGTTTTMVDAARTEGDADYWKGAYILFTSGTIANQCRLITAFNAATDTITFTPATTQAVGTNTYEILPAAAVDVRLLSGSEQSAIDLQDFADAGYDPATNKVQGVVLVDTLTTYTGNTPQTGDSFARLGAPAGASVSADIAAIEAQTDDIGVAGAGLTAIPWNAAWDAEVQSEVVDALTVDTYAEPGAVIAATSSLKDKISWLFALARNKITQTSTTQTLRNDADTANIATSGHSDDGTVHTRGEWT